MLVTKEDAIYSFWSSFGWPAYEENSLLGGESNPPALPYITYQVNADSFENETALTASLWMCSPSWRTINAKAQEVADHITRGGIMMHFDGGAVWIKRGTPFEVSAAIPTTGNIKRKVLNISVEFLTEN